MQDYEHHHGDAPSWILASLGDLPGLEAPAGADPIAGVGAACFYRAGVLSTQNGARVIARSQPTASVPNAPLAAVVSHGAGRVVVTADSDLFGDDCIADLDHEALWLNLVYWAAQPSFSAAAPEPGSAATDDPAWIRLRAAVEELRLAQAPDGSIDTSQHDPDKLRNLTAAIAESAQALKPRFPHQHDYIDALAADTLAWADAGYPKPAFDRSVEAFRPERDRTDGIEHLAVFPMYKQNASRDTCFEALVVRVPWPEWIAELERTRFDNAKYLPVTLVDYTSRLRLRVRRPLPRDVLGRRAPERLPLRRDLLRPRGRALPPRLRRRRGHPPPQPPARRRLPALLPRALPVGLHALGPSPRPHPHARRPPIRPVHDPPAQPVLDVLAGGAALRPHRVRRRGRARARGLRVRPPRPVRDPLRPPLPLPRDRLARAQLRRPRRPAPVRLPAPRGLPALDRQPPHDGVGPPRRGRRQAPRPRPGPLPLGHRPLEARPVDRRARPRRRIRAAGRDFGLGEGTPRPARGGRAEGARRPGPRRRVPAQPLLHPAAAEARAGARPAGRLAPAEPAKAAA